MINKKPAVRDIPAAVVAWVQAHVHTKLAGNPEADIEDVVQETLIGLAASIESVDSPFEEWTALAKKIADRRRADYLRKKYRKPLATSLDDLDYDPADQNDDIQQMIFDEWVRTLAPKIKSALRAVAAGNSEDEQLVKLFLEDVEREGPFPSFRAIGADIWPDRPQTACERFAAIFEKARHLLRRQGIDI